MSVPTYDKLIEHVLRVLAQHPDGVPIAGVYEEVANRVGLTVEEKAELLPSGSQAIYKNRVGWAYQRLRRAGLAVPLPHRVWQITQAGLAFASKYETIPPDEVERLAQASEKTERIDRNDPEVARACIKAMYPDVEARLGCLRWLADAVVYVHGRESACWGVTLHRRFVRFNVGRMLSLDLIPGEVRLGLAVASLTADDKAALDEHAQWSTGEPFAVTRECRVCVLPVALLLDRAGSLRPAWLEFLRIAVRTGRQTPFRRSHSPGVVTFIESALGRSLPRPEYHVPDNDDDEEEDGIEEGDQTESKHGVLPAVKADSPGQLFKETSPSVSGLLHELDSGDLGLPDIQRPFVWNATKVRDLIDSMYRGFPVGYLLFWETPPSERGSKGIGLEPKGHEPKRLIVDGQQRLTSLYAVLRGKPVLDDDFKNMTIEIAFRPRDSHFEVTSAAIRKDPEYIPSISEVWRTDTYSFTTAFLQKLEQRRTLTQEDRGAIAHNIGRLAQIDKYRFSALEILSNVDEEAVADVFVRINSQGVKLNQADFILTLLSVAWDQGRRDLEGFARACSVPPESGLPSPYNHFIKPSADQLLRVAIAIGFHRGKLRSAYQLLRGKDPDTGRASFELRKAQIARLEGAQSKVLNLTHWHGFMTSLLGAGVRSSALVSSEGALLFAYVFYLIGKVQCGADERTLKRLIGRWFFVTSLTGRYTGSSESALESDLGRVKDLTTPEPFVAALEGLITAMLPGGYWDVTIPAALETSGADSPAMLAYLAAQNRLGAPVLFGDARISDLLDPALATKRKTIEQHHLFPKRWLERQGIVESKRINQAANLALVEWVDNSDMSDSPPAEYVPALRTKFTDAAWARMAALHALPPQWELMPYDEFLAARRILMAQIIRQGFALLSAPGDGSVTLAEGTPDEQRVWALIPKVELRLREIVGKAYRAKWESGAEARMRAVLGDKNWEVVERNRERDAKKTGGSSNETNVLDYMYLRQLVDLLVANDVWEAFKPAFKEKQRPVALVECITAVRNDLAHFRSVAPLELDRCRIACTDLLNLLEMT
jgi:hypothetical protein